MSKTDNNRALSPPHISLASLADIIAAVRTYRIGTIPGGCRKKHRKDVFMTISFVTLRHSERNEKASVEAEAFAFEL